VSGQPGRKRNEASRQAILDATFALMQEDGYDRLSIEGVAARAGTGKATIYRWWPGKGALAVEAFLAGAEPLIAFRESKSAREDILRQMHSLATLYRGPTGRLVREMIAASQHDGAVRHAFVRGFLDPRRELARQVFKRGLAAGEFRGDVDPDVAIDALWAPIYYRLIVSGGPIDKDIVTAHAKVVLRGLQP
jgi:AcrR family transcriptional regulator